MINRLWPILAALLLPACSPEPIPAEPALWEVTGDKGERAWLFGTVHSLETPVDWRSAKVDAAMDQADLLMVEIADLEDSARISKTFSSLATSPGHPPLSRRVAAQDRKPLERMLDRHGFSDNDFANVETWAVALTLAQAETRGSRKEYGVDLAVLDAMDGKPVRELEGAQRQLSIFDALPESEQRDLLAAIVSDASGLDAESKTLAEAWRGGDMALIERETETGLLADPELRAALLTNRNVAWSKRIETVMESGARPFVAVGSAHMAGKEGLPALLTGNGFKVTRVQ